MDYPKLTAVLLEANKALNERLTKNSEQWGEKLEALRIVRDSKIQSLEAELEVIKAMLSLAGQIAR